MTVTRSSAAPHPWCRRVHRAPGHRAAGGATRACSPGVVLVVASALGMVWVIGASDDTVPVWSVQQDVPAGSALTTGDLTVVRVRLPAASPYLSATDPVPEGAVAARDFAAGELLTAVGIDDAEDGDSVRVVTMPVLRNQMPADLDVGDRVDVYVVERGSAGEPDGPPRLVHAQCHRRRRRRRRRCVRWQQSGDGGCAVGVGGRGRRPGRRAGARNGDSGRCSGGIVLMLRVATALTDAVLESAVVHAVSATCGRGDRGASMPGRGRAASRRRDEADRRGGGRWRAQRDGPRCRCCPVPPSGCDASPSADTGTRAAPGDGGFGCRRPGAVRTRRGPARRRCRADGRAAADRSHRPTDLSGLIVAVWGPTGAPGRTTVAVELAAAIAGTGRDTLLVDADTVGPSIALHLGLIDDTSGFAAAVRAASRGRLDPVGLAGLAVAVPSGPRVLVGLPSADRWTELRPASVDALLQCARATVPVTVVDIGFGVEGGDLDWADPGAPGALRRGASRPRGG